MTTTSQPVRVRPPDERPPASGSPRRRRELRRAVSLALLVAVPLVGVAAIADVVISGYHEHTAPPVKKVSHKAVDKTNPKPTSVDTHAPVGPDVGTKGLTAGMSRAVTRARADAAKVGISIDITSGYRTKATQQQLFDQAVAKYGTAKEASRWVLPPDKSEHVQGGAIDVGPPAAATWLQKNGVKYGLCRRYLNESWHFELLAPAKGQTCPAMERDASGN